MPATWRDLGELRTVEHECFGDDAWPLWDLVGVLTFPGVVRLKAVMSEKMFGFVAGGFWLINLTAAYATMLALMGTSLLFIRLRRAASEAM